MYAPNKTSEQILFFETIKDELNSVDIDDECRIIVGGDFNVILDPKLYGQGGTPKLEESVKQVENICSTHDLVDIWTHGPSFWKFNASLLNDCDFVALINNNYHVWLDEFKDITDPRLLWDLFEYKIRQDTISYSKEKAKERRAKLLELEKNLQHCQELYDEDPSTENMKKLEILKTGYH